MSSADFIYLASGSPRRRELLQQIGVRFKVIRTDLDETVRRGEEPPVSTVDARAPLVIGLAAGRSLREGRPVRIEEVQPA